MKEKEKDKIRKAKNAYMRSWRLSNPEKFKEIQDRYWLKKSKEAEQNKGATT